MRAALGQPDLDVEILSVLPWRMSALLAERMSLGRVFLAGEGRPGWTMSIPSEKPPADI